MSSEIKTNLISEVTSGSGVSIDGLNIKDSAINTGSINSSVVFPAGTILQIEKAKENVKATLAQTTHTIITTPTITVKKTNSEFILFGHTGGGFDTGSANVLMYFKKTVSGSATDIGVFTDSNRKGGISALQVTSTKGGEEATTMSGYFVDSPNLSAGSTITYSLMIRVDDGTFVKNGIGSGADSDYAHRWYSSILVYEVAV